MKEIQKEQQTEFDIAIIGGGPAGLTAGLYAARARMSTVIMEKMMFGGQAAITETIENYPGFPGGIAGAELTNKIKEQASKFGLGFIDAEVKTIEKDKISEKGFIVNTDGKEISALAVIIATGADPQRLGVPGESEFEGRGVSYCATCDGPFFRDQDIVVVGGGDTAVEEGLFLTKFGSKVTLVHRRDRLRATKILQERALANPKLDFAWDSIVTEVVGEDSVEGVKIKNVKIDEEKVLPARGVFVFVGIKPNTEFLQGLVEIDKNGYVMTDENMQSSMKGIYACGDARKKLLRQVVTACGEGATAAFSAQHYVEQLKGTAYE